MAFTTTDRDNLKAAIARGVRKVKMGDEEVEYQSLSDMRAALRMIEAELGGVKEGALSIGYPVMSRGL